MREEGVAITIPRKRGHVQVGYYFSCWDTQLKEYLLPDDAKRLLDGAWLEWTQIGDAAKTGAFEQHLCKSDDFIKDRTRDFVGREFVFKAVKAFVRRHDRGYFFIKGDPGIGKSSVAAWLVKQNGYIHHFNNRARGTGRTDTFLRSLCSQLILTHGLDYASLPIEASKDGRFLAGLLDEVARASNPSKKVIIVVDALDEVEQAPLDGANLLYLPPVLPRNLYVVATSRRQELPLRIECPRGGMEIEPLSPENGEDIGRYLKARTRGRKMIAYARRQGMDGEAFVRAMTAKSEGNFMYLRHVLPEIESGAYHDLDFRDIPVGLQDYYEDHWRRMRMMASQPPAAKIKILYILSEVCEPVSRKLIADFSSEEEVCVQGVLGEWEQFLHKRTVDGETRFGLYHESFRDFLGRREIVQAAGVSIEGINRLIAENLFTELYGNG